MLVVSFLDQVKTFCKTGGTANIYIEHINEGKYITFVQNEMVEQLGQGYPPVSNK